MKIKPLFDRVLLRPVTTQPTQSGILVPRESTERSQTMTILEIGTSVEANTFQIGEKVVVSKYAGTEITAGDEKLYVLHQYDILAKIQEDE